MISMSYSGHPNQYQSAPPPNYGHQQYQQAPPGYNPGAPPHGAQGGQYGAYRPTQSPATYGAHPPATYHGAPPAGYHGAPPPGYQGGPPPGYQGAAPPGYQGVAPSGHHSAAHTGGHHAAPPPAGYHGAPPPSYGHPPAAAYGTPAGYSQHQHAGSQYGAHPPPATNPYSTTHTGAPVTGHAPGPPPAPERACPPDVDPTLWQVFKVVDSNNSKSITANELQQALTNNNWTQFNAETCRLLIGQFDQNNDGSIDIYEFSHLWKYIQDWRQCFEGFDTDKSGTIDVHELQQAFQTFGYRLSMEFCRLCTRVFDRSDKHSMNFDSFIQCCVLLRSLTDSFKRRDTNMNGQIDVSYEDFLEMVIDNTVHN